MMNKQKGNMYGWVTHTWNVIKGRCPHSCYYCYMIDIWDRYNSKEQKFDEKELKTDLGQGNVIFVGSSTDMFAKEIPKEWIEKVLAKCFLHDKNTYLFQSKNPKRFVEFTFPRNTILGTTIETNNYDLKVSKAPSVANRTMVMKMLNMRKMISIEPILEFNRCIFPNWIRAINPEFVSIGADSKGHNLPEPSWDKVQELIKELKKFTEVKVKDNLMRLKCSYEKPK